MQLCANVLGFDLEAIKRLLLRESLNQPLIVIFEDLRWLDNETQAFLSLLSESLATARILLLVNYRPEYRHEWGNKTYYTQLRLDPLGPAEAQELLTALLGDDPALQPLKHLILTQTEGNPFSMEEGSADAGRGAHAGRRARPLPARAGDDRTPAPAHRAGDPGCPHGPASSLGEGVAADAGGDRQRVFLEPAAEGGVEQAEEELYRLLGHLQEGEFIYEQPAFPEPEYTFKHALIQEVAYNSLLVERRTRFCPTYRLRLIAPGAPLRKLYFKT